MQVTQLPEEFIAALPVMERLEEHGYEAYFVGGSVRDIMMDHPIHDVDIASSAYPEEVQAIFPQTIDLGIEHGTVLVLFNEEHYEITTFRTESEYQDYRRPDHVTFVRSLSEDLKRRDFRMNALAMNRNGEVIDLFDGLEDIKNHRICAVGEATERFHEDALRMMRAVRFASQLDFTIEEKTYAAIQEHHCLLEKISVERIQVEWLKLMAGVAPKKGLRPFIDTLCYESCPALKEQKEAVEQLYTVVNGPLTEEETWLTLAHFAQWSEKETSKVLRAWKCSNAVRQKVCHTLPYLELRLERALTSWELYQLGAENLELLLSVYHLLQPEEETTEKERYEQLAIHQIADLAVDGKLLMQELGEKPGPWLGKVLHFLQQQVVNTNVENTKEALLAATKQWLEEQ
ncbi:CCA tRNA nucleotidyltransferase [Catellicoccus marimammalium]|uniref:CCA-adding enzyme n=1 Tax=Catellicoccus marimammalium M35/04/3 TaxID=1234409 RepID=K8Z8U7_9ENTE|nr:CCA tRNA nucleotidyltransferase [Catellicoccus marimammalium]EKU27320.1 tRNA nucleotidyltransferase [Catellicoccus marimammalium M35/04/3]